MIKLWKAKDLIKLTLSITFIFILSSCEDEPGLTGSDFLTRNDSLLFFTDSNAVVYNHSADFYSDSSVYTGIGMLYDSAFGSKKASTVTQFSITQDFSTDFTNFKADSLWLSLKIAYNGGDTNSGYYINVYRLKKPLDGDIKMSEDLASFIEPVSITHTNQPLKFDSLQGVVNILLDTSYANEYLLNANYQSDSLFASTVYGIAIEVTSVTSQEGILFNIDYTGNNPSGLVLKYHNRNTPEEIKHFNYTMQTSDNRATLISNDYSGTDFNGQLDNNTQSSYGYLQSLNGVFCSIEFPGFEDWPSPEYINMATLTFEFVEDSLSPVPPYIGTFTKSASDIYGFIEDNPSRDGDEYYGGVPYNGKVTINITQHYRELVDGTFSDNNFYLMPVLIGDSDVYYDNLSYGRLIIDASSIEMNLVYTQLN